MSCNVVDWRSASACSSWRTSGSPASPGANGDAANGLLMIGVRAFLSGRTGSLGGGRARRPRRPAGRIPDDPSRRRSASPECTEGESPGRAHGTLRVFMSVDPATPVIVGVGQVTDRPDTGGGRPLADRPEPIDLMVEAVRAAIEDCDGARPGGTARSGQALGAAAQSLRVANPL